MEQMRAGDRKTFTVHGDTRNWFKGSIINSKAIYVPKYGGNRQWAKPELGNLVHDPAHPQQFHTIFATMTPVKGTAGEELKLGCGVQADMFITLEIRLPPQGAVAGVGMGQCLHNPEKGNLNVYQIPHTGH